MTTAGPGPDQPPAASPEPVERGRSETELAGTPPSLWRALPMVLLWGTAAYAAVMMFSLFRYSVDVPYWDQWNFVDFLRVTDDGVSWSELWAPHNEHRVLIPNIVLLVLARLTNWNVRAEIALVHGLLGLRVLIVLAVVWWAGRRARQATWACVPLLAAFLLTRAQAENFMWGWQVTLTLGALFTLLCCLVLVDATGSDSARSPGQGWVRFVIAAVLALASQFSFASGVVLWPLGALFLLIQGGRDRRAKLTQAGMWVAIGAIATFFYNRGLPYSPKTLPVTAAGIVEYSIKFLGAPLAPIRLVPAQLVAWRAGIAGLALFALGMLGVLLTGQWRRWAPITMWGLTAPATAGVTAIGRLGFVPVEQSMSSRYITMSTTMWASAAVLLTATVLNLAGRRRVAGAHVGRGRQALAFVSALMICVLAVGVVASGHGWDEWVKRRQSYSLRDRAFLADESQLTPEHKSWMYPDPAMIDKQRPYLLRKRLTVFRKRRPTPTGPVPGSELAPTVSTSIPATSIPASIPVTSIPATSLGATSVSSTSVPSRSSTSPATTLITLPATLPTPSLPPTVSPNLAPRPSVAP